MMSAEQYGVGFEGLWMTADPAASAATVPPVGIAMGKFHGGVTTTISSGWNCAPSSFSSSSACRA